MKLKYVFIVEGPVRKAKIATRKKIGVGGVSSYALFVKLTKALEEGGCRVVEVDDPGDESSK